ncbi:protein FAM229A [Perognathus longimembris pacificus]|uniref:protein FAM229A n=1 Tax=Perognathus longimembris pacificus TaxID=214514 RepID=UPI00201A044D|nr:protein FAM229A [Perognathus longimembris pacificus]
MLCDPWLKWAVALPSLRTWHTGIAALAGPSPRRSGPVGPALPGRALGLCAGVQGRQAPSCGGRASAARPPLRPPPRAGTSRRHGRVLWPRSGPPQLPGWPRVPRPRNGLCEVTMPPFHSRPRPRSSADTCPAPHGPERSPAAWARAAASSLGRASASRAPGLDMSAQEPPQGRRFPIEAGDSPGLAAAPEAQDSPEPVTTEHNPVRPLRRCPGCHCLTLLHVPIDVYLAMGGSPRARAT